MEILRTYLERLHRTASHEDAREESFYPDLKSLLEGYATATKRDNIHVTTLPKETEAGNPDFRVWDGKQHIVGYIEAKVPNVTDLDRVEQTTQLKRYRETFPNLILTNFLEFRFYRDGEMVQKVSIARPAILLKLQAIPPLEKADELSLLLEKFFCFRLPKANSAESLAQELATRTRFLRDEVIAMELRKDEKLKKDSILGFYEAFRNYLIGGLTPESFADLYAQTITYGLFAARTRAQNGFNRKLAYDYIPATIGILRELFYFISGEKLPQQMEWILDDIAEVLAITDVLKILQVQQRFLPHLRPRDPILHFYETFLAKYDPATREMRGVYYTPEPVVNYIVNSLHQILQEQFHRPEGLANRKVTVLDPAAGTGTFLVEAASQAVLEYKERYGDGGIEDFIRDHILKNYHAFELMMAPYAVGHLKISYFLDELGCRLLKEDRFKLYLTNALEMEELPLTQIPLLASLSEESHLAGKIKKETPILVILGNPPYSGHSANIGEWIVNKVRDYHMVDGKPLGEKNPKWLQDDYVKFIRFGQWKIDQAGEGVLGFITNHSYLDNPTFRGMRVSLMKSFDEIYVLDLHGNALKKEKCPDGSRDQNVFDIRQGVAISIFIKRKGKKSAAGGLVHHAERWGLREKKYGWLLENSLKTTKWQKLKPKSPHYLFVPRDEELLAHYESFQKITDIFPVNSVGIVTARDHLTIQWTPEEVWRTATNFARLNPELAREAYKLGKDAQDWKVESAQKDLKESGPEKKHIVPILYRPFDVRYTYYTGKSQGFHCRPRPEVMRHMLKDNLALCVGRAGQVVGLEKPWNIVFCANCIGDFNIFYRGGNVNFPLYIYDGERKPPKRLTGSALILFEPQTRYGGRKPNISKSVTEGLQRAFKKAPSPEQILAYIYAVLFSETYRKQYAEFLKSDFPRIPFTKDHRLFVRFAGLGQKLIDLHLLQSAELNRPVAKYFGKGDNWIEKVHYDEPHHSVHISASQHFEVIPAEVWNYQIGGYQVCEKWLKERRDKKLTSEEIETYCKLVTTIQLTIQIQREIDKIYPEVEKSLIRIE